MKQTALALTLLLAMPLLAQTNDTTTSTIMRNNTDFAAAASAGDAARITSFYADDATFMAPGSPAVRGHDAIGATWTAFLGMGKLDLKLTTDKVIESCDLATEIGHYSSTITPKGGAAMKDTGKYAVTWRKTGGVWKIVADIFNSDVPPAAAH
jgi:uncharacterized protein (TIGR02246 family)